MNSQCDQPNSLSPPPQKVGNETGFTLIEVLITLSILGLALTLISGFKPPWSATIGLRATATEVAAGLRLARSEAIRSNRPMRFELNLANHQYRVSTLSTGVLPPGLTIEMLTVKGHHRDAAGDIQFNPDGSSTGGRISLDNGVRRVAVGVDWLSGRVSIADVH